MKRLEVLRQLRELLVNEVGQRLLLHAQALQAVRVGVLEEDLIDERSEELRRARQGAAAAAEAAAAESVTEPLDKPTDRVLQERRCTAAASVPRRRARRRSDKGAARIQRRSSATGSTQPVVMMRFRRVHVLCPGQPRLLQQLQADRMRRSCKACSSEAQSAHPWVPPRIRRQHLQGTSHRQFGFRDEKPEDRSILPRRRRTFLSALRPCSLFSHGWSGYVLGKSWVEVGARGGEITDPNKQRVPVSPRGPATRFDGTDSPFRTSSIWCAHSASSGVDGWARSFCATEQRQRWHGVASEPRQQNRNVACERAYSDVDGAGRCLNPRSFRWHGQGMAREKKTRRVVTLPSCRLLLCRL